MTGRCNLCDDPRWRGWAHERSSWWHFPTMRPLLLKVHYPYDCGKEESVQLINDKTGLGSVAVPQVFRSMNGKEWCLHDLTMPFTVGKKPFKVKVACGTRFGTHNDLLAMERGMEEK